MLTTRAWWFLVSATLAAFAGIGARLPALTLTGLALLLWFGWEWLLFLARLQGGLRVEREVLDERGPVTTLWAGQTFAVRVRLCRAGWVGWPHVLAADPVPFGVEWLDGDTAAEGEVAAGRPLEMEYRIHCPAAGVARFEGLRVQTADWQGFFYRVTFVHAPVVLRVLPVLAGREGQMPSRKRHNLLLPPGIHRLHRPGSGSELLDLRDYRPGDPPKTIAWKVTARRDKLITKEFESEVPVRCTLFVDTSTSVRLASPAPNPRRPTRPHQPDASARDPHKPDAPARGPGQGKALDRLVELAAGLLQVCNASRDPAGLCLFDEHGASTVRPDRSGPHLTRMLHLLADAAALSPASARVNPDHLLPLAHSFAQEVYPDLLRQAVNAVPFWYTWFLAVPRHSRRLRTVRESLYHHKRMLWFWGSAFVSVLLYLLPPAGVGALVLLLLLLLVPSVLPAAGYVFILAINRRRQRLTAWRKRTAAVLSALYGLAPGGVEALLEDDDACSLLTQRFLADHRVPYSLPLYDSRGRYRFAAPEKVPVLADALVAAVGKGHDNELFVLLADLLELDDHLAPLLRAVRVALARHHQVLVVCPWPHGLALPPGGSHNPEAPARGAHERVAELPAVAAAREASAAAVWGRATTARFHGAYQRVRRTFARLGVPVVCAAGDEPVPLVLDRLERLRMVGRRRP
jgi:uncharacterized protein (DUF58 family)